MNKFTENEKKNKIDFYGITKYLVLSFGRDQAEIKI